LIGFFLYLLYGWRRFGKFTEVICLKYEHLAFCKEVRVLICCRHDEIVKRSVVLLTVVPKDEV
jgi:hypothetical protein